MKVVKLTDTLNYVTDKVPEHILSNLNMETFERYNSVLAGYIEDEFELSSQQDQSLVDYLNLLVDQIEPTDVDLDSIWVNFQKKGEFNPPHGHSGAYSFVIWYDIPFTLEAEEKAVEGFNWNPQISGQFYFVFAENDEVCFHYPGVDNKWNGHIAVFPSSLMHGVHPFRSSDGIRTTVAGNLVCK